MSYENVAENRATDISSRAKGGVVYVEFKGNRRESYYNPFEFPFKRGDLAIVAADRGDDAGKVKHVAKKPSKCPKTRPQFDVIRLANSKDLERQSRLAEKEQNAIMVCNEKIEQYRLPMKLVDSEYRFDGLKLNFFFKADGRIDFRELVRDLASVFRTRIELRQIGARDETKRCCTMGVCGKELCCSMFMTNFLPITTNMAKDQNLQLNPSKLSGVCGRLKCCLAFETPEPDSEVVKSSYNRNMENSDVSQIEEISD